MAANPLLEKLDWIQARFDEVAQLITQSDVMSDMKRYAKLGKEYKELVRLISRNEEKLLATMTEEQKDLFSRYTDCVREHQATAECLLFQNSFRLGGRMMLEVMRGGVGDE